MIAIKILGQRIQNIRKDRKITLDVLAKLSGVSQSYLSRIENGKHDPTFSVLLQIARALKVQVAYLYEEEDIEKNYTIVRVQDRIKHEHIEMGYVHWELPTHMKNRKMFAYIVEPPFESPVIEGNDERTYFVLEGVFQINDTESLYPGDIIYLAPNTPHYSRSVGNKKAKILSVITSLDDTVS